MDLRFTLSGLIAAIMLLAIGAAVFRVYTAPDRIARRLQTAEETCNRSGGSWIKDMRGSPLCKRD